MRTPRLACIAIWAALVALLGLGAVSASASTLWVSNNPPSPPFTSCEHPGYNSIQAAVAGPGTAIHVCKGTYAEQLQVERSVKITGYEGATLKLPANPETSTTPCDKANESGSGLVSQDALSVCGHVEVAIKGLNVEAIWPGQPLTPGVSCGYRLSGILAAGGAELQLSDATVTGARPSVINGCQYGVGVQIGSYYDPPATATLKEVTVSEYQKNGITVEGAGTTATIDKTTVTGAGPTEALAQNGIGVEYGASAAIEGVSVSGNECNNPTCGSNPLADYQSDGVYFYEGAAGSSISKSKLTENDVGVETFNATSAGPLIEHNTAEANRYESVSIGQGAATINKNTLTGANVGIELLQFAGQEYGISATATGDTITGTNKWAVLGSSDNSPSDLYGEFSITKSKISDNPGTRPLESVESENPTGLRIFAEKDK